MVEGIDLEPVADQPPRYPRGSFSGQPVVRPPRAMKERETRGPGRPFSLHRAPAPEWISGMIRPLPRNRWLETSSRGTGSRKMRVVLSPYGSRGDGLGST